MFFGSGLYSSGLTHIALSFFVTVTLYVGVIMAIVAEKVKKYVLPGWMF